MSLERFLVTARARIHSGEETQRYVHFSKVARAVGEQRLEDLMADRSPLFYRSPDQIADMLRNGYFRTAFPRCCAAVTHFGSF